MFEAFHSFLAERVGEALPYFKAKAEAGRWSPKRFASGAFPLIEMGAATFQTEALHSQRPGNSEALPLLRFRTKRFPHKKSAPGSA